MLFFTPLYYNTLLTTLATPSFQTSPKVLLTDRSVNKPHRIGGLERKLFEKNFGANTSVGKSFFGGQQNKIKNIQRLRCLRHLNTNIYIRDTYNIININNNKSPNLKLWPSVFKTQNALFFTLKIKQKTLNVFALFTIKITIEFYKSLLKSTINIIKQIRVFLFENTLKSIYTFFEKPGILIVDWIAYMFLVEWVSDITNTIPENVDYTISTTSYKMSRINLLTQISFLNIPNTLGVSTYIQKRLYNLYEILLYKCYQPDTDLIIRQKKGLIFWEIWGDFLMQVAEDSNMLNITEITTLKEEQLNLFMALTKAKIPLFSIPDKNFTARKFFETGKKINNNRINNIIKNSNLLKKIYTGYVNKIFTTKDAFAINSQLEVTIPAKKSTQINIAKTARVTKFNSRNAVNKQNFYIWGAQQYLSYQGKDTELFIDLHPRGNLQILLKSIFTLESFQQPIGS